MWTGKEMNSPLPNSKLRAFCKWFGTMLFTTLVFLGVLCIMHLHHDHTMKQDQLMVDLEIHRIDMEANLEGYKWRQIRFAVEAFSNSLGDGEQHLKRLVR